MSHRPGTVAGALLAVLWLAATAAPAQRPAPRFLAHEAVVQGSGDAELRWPVAVAAGSTFQLAVADAYGARLILFTETGRGVADSETAGRFASGIGWAAAGVVELPATPLAVVYDGRRYVVALRGHGDLATIPPPRSARLAPGLEPGSLTLPKGTVPGALAATAGGGLLIYDAASGRVLELDDADRLVADTLVDDRLTSLAAAPGGGFYAAFVEPGRGRQARTVRYGTDGRVAEDWRVPGVGPVPAWPDGLVVEPSGLLLADRHGGRVLALDGTGRLTGIGSGPGWKPGHLLSPAGMTRLADGRLAVADRGNGRVQIFRSVRQDLGPGSPP